MNFKRFSSITSSLFFSCGLTVFWQPMGTRKHLGRLCCHRNYMRIKLYIYTVTHLPFLKSLSYWQHCIASFSTTLFKRTLLAISKISNQHLSDRRNKIVMSLSRHHRKVSKNVKGGRTEYLTNHQWWYRQDFIAFVCPELQLTFGKNIHKNSRGECNVLAILNNLIN